MATIDLDLLYSETMSKFEQLWQGSESGQSGGQPVTAQDNFRTEKRCEFCQKSQPATRMIKHHIVPEDIVTKVGLTRDRIVELCLSCHKALHDWNNRNVFWVRYEEETRRHKARSLAEIAREYESGYWKFMEESLKQESTGTSPVDSELEVAGNLRSVT